MKRVETNKEYKIRFEMTVVRGKSDTIFRDQFVMMNRYRCISSIFFVLEKSQGKKFEDRFLPKIGILRKKCQKVELEHFIHSILLTLELRVRRFSINHQISFKPFH